MQPLFLINPDNKEVIDAIFTAPDKTIICAISEDKRLLVLADPQDVENNGSAHLFKLDDNNQYSHAVTFKGKDEENIVQLGTLVRIIPDTSPEEAGDEEGDPEENFINDTVEILGVDAEDPTRLTGFETYENFPTDDCPSGWESPMGIEGIADKDEAVGGYSNARVGKDSFVFKTI